MKLKTLVFLLLLVLCHTSSAQDTIVRTDGSTVVAKVLEVGPELVKYRRFADPEGALFIVHRSQLKMIRYANGVSDSLHVSTPPMPVLQAVQSRPALISQVDGTFYYGGKMITERQLYDMLESSNDTLVRMNGHREKIKRRVGKTMIGLSMPVLCTGAAFTIIGGLMSMGRSRGQDQKVILVLGLASVIPSYLVVVWGKRIVSDSYEIRHQMIKDYNRELLRGSVER